jgi:hypothetical protein
MVLLYVFARVLCIVCVEKDENGYCVSWLEGDFVCEVGFIKNREAEFVPLK